MTIPSTPAPTRARRGGNHGSPEAARAVWDWKREAPVQRGPHYSRVSALPGAVIGAAAGGVLWWLGHTLMAQVVWGITALLVLAALVSPNGIYAAIRPGLDRFGFLVGRGLSWVLLMPLFYLFFFPFGALGRRGRRDSMKRWTEPEAPSYWTQRTDSDRGPERFERQF